MNQAQTVVRVRRSHRSAAAILELVEEFHASGLTQTEFCQRRGVVRNTLNRYLNKQRNSSPARGVLVAVEVAGPLPLRREVEKALAVILPMGRKIEVGVRFDASTLARVLQHCG
jgi:transcriptional regulator with XRE-family HTH domain